MLLANVTLRINENITLYLGKNDTQASTVSHCNITITSVTTAEIRGATPHKQKGQIYGSL